MASEPARLDLASPPPKAGSAPPRVEVPDWLSRFLRENSDTASASDEKIMRLRDEAQHALDTGDPRVADPMVQALPQALTDYLAHRQQEREKAQPAPVSIEEPEPEATAISQLEELDQVRARRIVTDYAMRYARVGDRESVVRNLAEGLLHRDLIGSYNTGLLWSVADELVTDEILDPHRATALTAERRNLLDRLGSEVSQSLSAGHPQSALVSLREAERLDPDHLITPQGQTVAGLRVELERHPRVVASRARRRDREARALERDVTSPDPAQAPAESRADTTPADRHAVARQELAESPQLAELPDLGAGQSALPRPVADGSRQVRPIQAASLEDPGSVPVRGGPRVRANFAALELSIALDDQRRDPTPQERLVLDGWRAWGATPELFDAGNEALAGERERLQRLIGPEAYAAARRTTINAHYTDPTIVGPMWQLLTDLGYRPGRHAVLEPGCGAGGFFDQAPQGLLGRAVGVELDPVTARIAAQRHPTANIRTESFADSTLPDAFADVVIGNVPFADVALHDPRHNPGRGLTMHNHFLVKSLHLTAPGGVVVALTSRYTLDSRSRSAREAMYELGDLLGAVRLPTGAHARHAGTEVVTDLLVLRRRGPAEARGDATWLTASPSEGLGGLPINDHFTAHPEDILGSLEVGQGIHGSATVQVRADEGSDLGALLGEHLADLATRIRDDRDIEAPAPVIVTDLSRQLTPPPVRVARADDPSRTVGFLSVDEAGTIMRRSVTGDLEPAPVPKAAQREVRDLLGMRDTVLGLLQAQAADATDTPAMDVQRRILTQRYQSYVARYGPINRYTVSYRTGRNGGPPIEARRVPTAIRAVASDPYAGTIKALEIFDDASRTATPASVFTRRVVAPRTPRTDADSPADALAITLDTHGRVDLEHVAELLGTDVDTAREELGTLVFNDPADERLVPAAEYLSGRVREKLDIARDAVPSRPELAVNVTALEDVVPADLGPQDITVRLGAVWVPATDVEAFFREVLDDPRAKVAHDGGSHWRFTGSNYSVAATQEWGTSRRDAYDLADSLAAQKRIVVEDSYVDADGRDRLRLNIEETAAAQAKAEALNERFGQWIWEDPDRAARLAALYNQKFNGLVARTYDTTAMSFPGLAATFTPRAHQKAAVARMIYEPSVGLFHEVGAGKTAEMVIGCMELRRLGLVNKPAIVVPNHMLEQFGREFLQLYPQAQILAASSADLTGDKRRELVSRAALGDWDAVILTQGALKRIPVSGAAEASYVRDCAAGEQARLAAATARGDQRSIKQAEKRVLAATEKAKSALDVDRDAGITFEQTGIDYLCVDEMHLYKNLGIESRDRSLARDGSDRATDLDMKIGLLRSRAGTQGRVVTGATATPIANSVAEMYVMQHYLRPDLLSTAGLSDFDSWAVTFGKTVTDLELDPAGGGKYRIATRFAKFANVPELLRMWSIAGDVKTAEDLGLPTPDLAARPDGTRAPEVVLVDPSPATEEYVASLVDRAEAVRSSAVDRETDNMLLITSDGRAAALDVRLVSPRYPAQSSDEPGTITKVTAAADRIHRIWSEHRDDVFLDAAGEPHPQPGSLQLVFCDLGTPSEYRWSAYTDLRRQLVERGMDPSRVRFIHEAKNDAEKARLFAACRTGQVDVIIGSTEKMGVGTNIQDRAIALHHLDCPWRPADIAQREGRIVRQGNQHPEVQILRYITKRTFDAYSWQTVERKAGFIAQVMKGRLDVREIEDIGNAALSFAEVKALAADDPNTLRRAQAQAEVTRLERAETAHLRGQSTLRYTTKTLEAKIGALTRLIPELEDLAGRRRDTRGDLFAATIQGSRLTHRADAAEYLSRIIASAPATVAPGATRVDAGVVSLGGVDFDLHISRSMSSTRPPELVFRAAASPEVSVALDMVNGASGAGAVARLENRVHALPSDVERAHQELGATRKELARAQQNVGLPFKDADELATARRELADVEEQIEAAWQESQRQEEAPPDEIHARTQAVADHLPGAVAHEDALTYRGVVYAIAGDDEHDPLETKLGFWGHADADGQPVTGPCRWDAEPADVARWIRNASPRPSDPEPQRRRSVSDYGDTRPAHGAPASSRLRL